MLMRRERNVENYMHEYTSIILYVFCMKSIASGDETTEI